MQKIIETNNATKGMDLQNGKRHYDSNGNPLGGIKAKVINSDNQQIEVEMGEVIITRDAVSNPKKYKIEGTTKEILSTLNQEGGGVPINETEAKILDKYRTGGKIPREKHKLYLGEEGGMEVSPKGMFDSAVQMEKDGIDSETIRSITGWFRSDLDGLWRYEISDNEMEIICTFTDKEIDSLKTDEDYFYKDLKDVIKHDELFKAYPRIKYLRVFFMNVDDKPEASLCTTEKGKIFIICNLKYERAFSNNRAGVEELGGREISGNRRSGEEQSKRYNTLHFRKVITHELQHAIQVNEGLAEGGNPNIELKKLKADSGAIHSLTEKEQEYIAIKRFLNKAGEIEAMSSDVRIDYDDLQRRRNKPYSEIAIDPKYFSYDLETKIKFDEGGKIPREKQIYLGKEGGSNVSPKGMFEEAVDMEKLGFQNEEIRKKTGWFRNPFDKLWRFEISDREAKINLSKIVSTIKKVVSSKLEVTLSLKDIYTNNELSKAYGKSIEELPFVFYYDEEYEGLGSLNIIPLAGKVFIKFNVYEFLRGNVGEVESTVTERGKLFISFTTHELQHAVQVREGLSSGGSVEQEYRKLLKGHKGVSEREDRLENNRETREDVLLEQARLNYLNHLGEIEASDSDVRKFFDKKTRIEIPPYSLINFNNEEVIVVPETKIKFRTGGELIKRADGSYSRRGLWDNIRDNIGSGRKPTKQMLEQEAKIKAMREGGEIPSLIEKGIVDLKFHETTPEHAEIYGLTAENPLYIQTLYVNDDKRLQGIGTKVLKYIDSIAKRNGNDMIFGHINQKATFTKDEKETTFNDIDMVKSWLHDNGYSVNEENNDFHKVVKFKTGGSIKPNFSKMTPSEIKEFYNSPEGKKLDAETYSEWKRLVNMTKSELEKFYNSEEGKEAGLTTSQAKEQGIDSGRESARWIMKMKNIPYKEWSSDMWRWAKKQINFIKRMSGMKGRLYDENGNKTREHTALLIWGHNPEQKFAEGGGIGDKDPKTYEEIREYAENVLKEFNPRYSAYSDTNGQSMYFNVGSYENPIKVRFSDHSVTNRDRMSNEVHFSLRNVNSDYTKFNNEQKILEIRYRLGDKNIISTKREMLMPSGKFLQGFGYVEKFRGGGELSQKALNVETNDLTDFVRKYFIKDGRIDVSDAMQELFGNKKGKSIADEYRKRIGLHKKGGLTISQLAHKLWEEHRDEVREGIDDSDFRNAVEEVLISEYGVSSMINSLIEKSSESEEDKENEYWMKRYGEDEDYYDDYYEDLTDEEVADYFRDMEGFERETYKGNDSKIIISGVEIPKEIDELFKEKYKLDYYYSFYGDILNSFPKDEMGLTIDSAKNTKEYKDVKQKFDLAKIKSNEFNSSKEGKKVSDFYSKIDRMSRIEIMKHYIDLAKELAKGTEHEMEHLETLKKVAEHKITPEEAVVETSLTHIKENPNYYEDLAKMEAENEESIPDLIEGLKVLADSLEGEEKKDLEDTIEGLKLLL